jgi:hypothetical protein
VVDCGVVVLGCVTLVLCCFCWVEPCEPLPPPSSFSPFSPLRWEVV